MEPGKVQADPVAILTERFRAAIVRAWPALANGPIDPVVTVNKQPKLGDFQCNAAMSLAKQLGSSPREVAKAIVSQVEISDLAEPVTEASIAGPGFINIRLKVEPLGKAVEGLDTQDAGVERVSSPEVMVVDLCGVNLAKEMHIGHLRATVIGDTIARCLERLGHRVVRQNHVGDWGLPIAMATWRLAEDVKTGRITVNQVTLPYLTEIYRDSQADCTMDAKGLAAAARFGHGPKALAELEEQVRGAEAARAKASETLLRLQAKDPAVVAFWQRIYDVTMAACLATCQRLRCNITDADSAGESSYANELVGMAEDLLTRGVAEVSDGALVVRLNSPEHGGIEVPCMVRKSDGGFPYAATDVCAVRRRVRKFGATRVIYAVGSPQSLHLAQVFATARRAGYATRDGASSPSSLEHAAFGSILGEDGKPFKTRSGENVRLSDVLDEGVARAERAVAEKNPEIPPEERRAIAEAVGIAAIKYADLCTERIKDYIFAWDRMLAFEGNTGPYLLYALVRIRSIFRKAMERGITEGEWTTAPIRPTEPAEKALALTLLRYPSVVETVADRLEPHRLCGYVYELAGAFSTFFDQCPVLTAPDEGVRASRLRLCRVVSRVLGDGLGILGIPTVDRM